MSALSSAYNTLRALPSGEEAETFFYAAQDNKPILLTQLLDTYGAHIIEVKDSIGHTALIAAAKNGYTSIVSLLLDKGANIEAKTNGGFTALIWAAWQGHAETVRFLLERGAEIGVETNTSNTALTFAVRQGHTEVEALIRQRLAEQLQQKQLAEKRVAEVAAIHSGIDQEVKVGARLALRLPTAGIKR